MSKEFKLSASLYGHSLDIRSVTASSDNTILSGSRDKTAKLWKPNGINTGYTEVMTYRDQKNFVIAVLYLEPTPEFPDGLVITGGNDNTIYVYKPSEPFASFTIKEHSNAVSCFSRGLAPNSILSGSWDSSAKYWVLNQSKAALVTFSGHAAAIWGVLQLRDSRIVTASADKTIGIWTKEGQRLNTLTGHTDCVRGLLDMPEAQKIISVANDATVKVWSYAGENLDTYFGHSCYIYSIARCQAAGEDCFVTSDEDRTVRFWEHGENTQTFRLPAQSVWSVACLSNGDIVTGSSDGVVRVFTQDENRFADEATLNKYNEEVEILHKQSVQEIGGYKVSDLPGKEALYDPGKKPGQMKMIRENNGVVAYTWVEEAENSHWEKIGEVLGGTDKGKDDKKMYEGKSYDFVFSVDVEDGKPPLKLPYNKGQDPYQAANEFLTRNLLPSSYLEEVVNFILKNSKEDFVPANTGFVDPFTGASRYTPGSAGSNQGAAGMNVDPFTGGNSYSTSTTRATPQVAISGANNDPFTGGSSYTSLPDMGAKYFPITAYRTFDMGDPNVVLGKLKEFNAKWGASNGTPVEDVYLEELAKICSGPPSNPNTFDVLFKILDWPDDIVFPVLDVVRMAVRHKKNNEIISDANNGSVVNKLLSFISENCKIVNNLIVSLRTFCNLFAHERGEDLIFDRRFDIIENITALGVLNKNGQIALATFLLNLTIATLRKRDELGISILGDVIPDILTKLTDPESQFRGYVALGTLLTSATSPQILEVKTKVKGNGEFVSALQLHILAGHNDVELKKSNCAKQVQLLLSLSF